MNSHWFGGDAISSSRTINNVCNSSTSPIYKERLRHNYDKILSLLDEDDLMSLVFLVLRSEQLVTSGFKYMSYIKTGKKMDVIFYLWDNVGRDVNGPDLFASALITMGCYDILEDELAICTKHKLREVNNTLHVERQALYQAFEGLTPIQTDQLMSRLSHWSFGSCDERMESAFCRNLTMADHYSQRIIDVYEVLRDIDGARHLAELLSPFTSNESDKVYRLPTGYPHGLCVIINVKHFMEPRHDSTPLPTRHGSDIDKIRLSATFKLFGFEVFCLDDPDLETLKTFFKHKIRQNGLLSLVAALAICVMTHGDDQDNLFLHDRQTIRITELRGMCQAISLLKKPRMIFIQACRGEEKLMPQFYTRDGSVATTNSDVDCIISTATIHGHSAFRSASMGSWFITDLCAALQEKGHNCNLKETLRDARGKICKRVERMDGTPVTMLSEDMDTLLKDVQLVRTDIDKFVDGVIELIILDWVNDNFDTLIMEFEMINDLQV